MPTKVSVGLSKKAGLPDFGSIGTSCHVELELDGQILDGDLDRFRRHVRRAYAACRDAVEEELAKESVVSQSAGANRLNGNGHHGNGNGQPSGNANGTSRRRPFRPATASQQRAIKAIAGRNRIDLVPLLARLDVQRVEDLSISDASSLIDELKGKPSENGATR